MQKQAKTRRAASPAQKLAAELPDWLTETPQDLDYQLEVWDPDTVVQGIDLTRAEYIALKEHLAKMRGFSIPEVAHA